MGMLMESVGVSRMKRQRKITKQIHKGRDSVSLWNIIHMLSYNYRGLWFRFN